MVSLVLLQSFVFAACEPFCNIMSRPESGSGRVRLNGANFASTLTISEWAFYITPNLIQMGLGKTYCEKHTDFVFCSQRQNLLFLQLQDRSIKGLSLSMETMFHALLIQNPGTWEHRLLSRISTLSLTWAQYPPDCNQIWVFKNNI